MLSNICHGQTLYKMQMEPYKMSRPSSTSRIAVIGAGIAGMSAAYLLSEKREVGLFEKEDRLAGHMHTDHYLAYCEAVSARAPSAMCK